jgi:hypothetical protein
MNPPRTIDLAAAFAANAFTPAKLHDFIDLVHPLSSRNPFRHESARMRNWVLINLLARAGLRLDEALALHCRCLEAETDPQTGCVSYRLHVKPVRGYGRPGRLVPLSPSLAALIKGYVDRRSICGSDQLLADARGRLISRAAAGRIFERVSKALTGADSAPPNACVGTNGMMTPRNLHLHGALVRCKQFLKLGLTRDEAIQAANALLGWEGSSMAELLLTQPVDDALVDSWDRDFDRQGGA